MKIKGALLTGAAIAICGISSGAQASTERLSMYEVNTYIAEMTNAINNPNPNVNRSFFERKVSSTASFQDTKTGYWANGQYMQAANGYYGASYYRYPYAYNTYAQPTSYQSLSKHQMVNSIEQKKVSIPRYHQSMHVLGTIMPANATTAVVDVQLKEMGLSYALAPYGVSYGQKVAHANSRCQLHLKKELGNVIMTRMACNTLTR